MKTSNPQQAELSKFQSYLKVKKQNCFKEARLTLQDFKADNVSEKIFNREDVEDLLNRLAKDMESTYNQEIDHLIGFAGSYVNTALKEAEKNGFEINVDIDFLDNKEAMESLKAATKQIAKKGEGYKGSVDDLLLEIDVLKTKNKKMQEEIAQLSKNKESGWVSSDLSASVNESQALKEKLKQREEEIEALTSDMNKKLNESVQFSNLKKMMQQRNEQIKKLRERLGKYENVEDIKMD